MDTKAFLRTGIVLVACVLPVCYASVVTIQKNGTAWQLLKDGKAYYVKGAGGGAYPEKLVACGGNSIRTWSPDKSTLDKAQSLGLTVCLGISGSDITSAQQSVTAYKDHPALLMWGLGNEMESSVTDQVALWQKLNSIALMVKSMDPNHPCITAVADIGGTKLQNLAQYAPALDAVGINTYNGLSTLKTRVTQTGWTKPYFVTEFGPVGWWECPKTPWGLPLEQTSSEKESTYVANYQKSIAGNDQCLGGYVFLWGNKMEKTHTWFGMFLADGSPTNTVDGMQYVWTGAYGTNRSPRIKSGKIKVGRVEAFNDGADRYFRPSQQVKCVVDADDPNGDSIIVSWDLRVDVSDNTATGGAYETPSTPIANAVISSSGSTAVIQLPAEAKNYRIFCYVKDPKGSVATANCPIVVDPNAPMGIHGAVSSMPSAISYDLFSKDGSIAVAVRLQNTENISIAAYNANGRKIKTIKSGLQNAGTDTYYYKVKTSGEYFIKLFSKHGLQVKKIVL